MHGYLKRLRDLVSARMFVRGAFFVYFVWAVVRLLRFVAWARGRGPYVARPEAVAGILPVGHYTSFFAWVRGGGWDTLLPAGLAIIIGAITLSVLFKRGFCGWICPVGTVWEAAALLGRKLVGRTLRLPKWLDVLGKVVRYALAAAVLAFLMLVPLSEAVGFRHLPYMWVADVKIVEGFGNPVFLAVALLAFVVSMLLGPVWCRYVCPLGGWYSLLGVVSPCAVTRDPGSCISCHRCTSACHALIDVENAATVRSVDCDGCMDCVRACPAPGALEAKAFGRVRIAPWAWAALVVGLWLAIYAGAKATGHWDTTIQATTFRQVITSGELEQRTPGGL